MKVIIWTNSDPWKSIQAKKIWVGDMECIPRQGDVIQILERVETVERVEWIMCVDGIRSQHEAHLCVEPDYNNIYKEIK